jgi:hypothetical protein
MNDAPPSKSLNNTFVGTPFKSDKIVKAQILFLLSLICKSYLIFALAIYNFSQHQNFYNILN